MVAKIYQASETPITWLASGGTEAITLDNLAFGAGRVGDQHDFGALARSSLYEWVLTIDGFATAPAIGEIVELHFAQSDGTDSDGQGIVFSNTGDVVLSSLDILPNLHFAGAVVTRSVVAADKITARGVTALTSRYVVPVVVNRSVADNLRNAAAHKIILTPIPWESQ